MVSSTVGSEMARAPGPPAASSSTSSPRCRVVRGVLTGKDGASLADDLVAVVSHDRVAVSAQRGDFLVGQRVEPAEDFEDHRRDRAGAAILDLYGNPPTAIDQRHAMAGLSAGLRED